MKNYLLKNATVKSITEFPEPPKLPELNSLERAKLYKYFKIVRQSFITYLRLYQGDDGYEFIHSTGVLFTALTMSLLSGANTIEEYLNRDESHTYSFTSSHDIIIEKDDKASYICPKCCSLIEFPRTPENYETLEQWGASICCPYCLENDPDIKQIVLDIESDE